MKSKNTPFKSKFQKLTSGDISRIKKVPKITSIGGLKNIPKSNLKQYDIHTKKNIYRKTIKFNPKTKMTSTSRIERIASGNVPGRFLKAGDFKSGAYKPTLKSPKITKLKKLFSVANPLGALSVLSTARKLNIKGGRTTDVYQKRKKGYLKSGKKSL